MTYFVNQLIKVVNRKRFFIEYIFYSVYKTILEAFLPS